MLFSCFTVSCSSALCAITPDDNSEPVVTVANCRQVESTLKLCVDHLQMRFRKRKSEEESYRIARESVYGWKTQQLYRKDAVFGDEDDLDFDTPWWKKPEVSKEKKLEKLKQSDREVKFQLTNRRQLQQNSFSSSQSYFQPGQIKSDSGPVRSNYGQYHPYGRDTRRCNWCHVVGHIASFCPQKARQYQPQHPQPHGHPGQGPSQQQIRGPEGN